MKSETCLAVIRLALCRLAADPKRKADNAAYMVRARTRIALQAAASAWAQGVPWAEALRISNRAIEKADPRPKALPRRRRAAR